MKLPLKQKRFVLQYLLAMYTCWEWGERATPRAVKFVWNASEPDWKQVESDPEWKWGKLT